MSNDVRRFEFGKNWLDYVKKNLSQEKIDISKDHILSFLGQNDLNGISVLDIGCGSGLHSLAAQQAGAESIFAFDYDPSSVAAAEYVREHYMGDNNWTISQGSVLDDAFMAELPLFDLVYSWGVLHHTGDVWRAIHNAAAKVRPGGRFYIALYSADMQKDPPAEFWLDVKRKYVSSGWFVRRFMDLWYVWRFQMNRKLGNLPKLFKIMREYKKSRGMNYFTDVRDWLGGWPMEFVFDDDVVKCFEEMGFKLEKISTGEANTEFLFIKK